MTHHIPRVSILIGLCLAVANGATAQISSINSAVITPRVFNDFPGATFTSVNNYPSSITLGEAGAYNSATAPNGLNRDFWQFSNNGTSPYTFGANDFFTASMTLTLSGTT